MERPHQPVLLEAVLRLLNPQSGESYLDATAGYGGHAAAVIEQLGEAGRAILVDRDIDALEALISRFGGRVELRHQSYLEAARELLVEEAQIDLILLDLGVSSPQLDQASRGFSFQHTAPLDMRMDHSQTLSAAEVVNHYPAARLETVIRQFGEEPRARRIARWIIAARPITTTTQLAEVVSRAVGKTPGRIHPATRTFQAIRIEVNQELEQLATVLPLLVDLLAPGGRLAVISFHSLEDRLVKQFLVTESRDCVCLPGQPICTCDHHASLRLLTKRPIAGAEDVFNPRARSAKLRAAEKLNQK